MYSLVFYPKKSLNEVSKKVTRFDDALKQLAIDMNATMIKENGIGLAAPQIGKNIQLAIVKIEDTDDFRTYINPVITMYSKKKTAIEEGCLSIPSVFGYVERSHKIHVHYYDLDGKKHISKLSGMNAIVVQHEVDHLKGFLIVNRPFQLTRGDEFLNISKK